MFEFLSWRGRKAISDSVEFTAELRTVLQRTREQAMRHQSPYVGMEHIVLAILESPESEASRVFTSLGLRSTELRAQLEGSLSRDAPVGAKRRRTPGAEVSWSSKAKQAIVAAVDQARELKQSPVSSGHLLLALLRDSSSGASRALAARGITVGGVSAALRRGVAPTAELNIQLDDQSDRLIYEQIVTQIQEAIATGQLLAGQRLPPIRQLADQLNVAPGTVARAYAQLESAGTVSTDRARGTFVAIPGKVALDARPIAIRDLLRPAVVAAFHLGSSADELKRALAEAMADIYPDAA